MRSLDDLVECYTLKYDSKIKLICQPLVDLLDIPFFTYYQITTNGNFVILSNFPEQCDFYYRERMYLTNPYLTHPHLMRTGCVLTASTSNTDYLKTIELSQQQFQLHNTFLMIQRSDDLLEGFFFGTHNDNKHFFHHYLNHMELLKKFGCYFLQEAEPLIKQIKEDNYNIWEAKGKAFLERDFTLPLSSKNCQIDTFLKQISHLSPREQECLDLFRKGNSAQATAAKLGLSRRTIEHYFESIKCKLGCHSKWDLLNRQ